MGTTVAMYNLKTYVILYLEPTLTVVALIKAAALTISNGFLGTLNSNPAGKRVHIQVDNRTQM